MSMHEPIAEPLKIAAALVCIKNTIEKGRYDGTAKKKETVNQNTLAEAEKEAWHATPFLSYE